jgi:hypothetical protein
VIFTRHSSKSSTYIGGLCLFQGRLRPATALLFAAGRYRRCKAPATVKHLQPDTMPDRAPCAAHCGRWFEVLAHWNTPGALQLVRRGSPDTSHEACETSGRARRTRRTQPPTYPSESAPTGYRLQDEIVAFHGLPQHVTFCSRCVISNRRPNSCAEFRHTKVRSSSGCLDHPSLCFGRVAWFRAR